ncbi:hypothetical protein EE612_045861 [Oryza sativa]|nr:hypothetical protein EE612_045861 [Oryza sativa]
MLLMQPRLIVQQGSLTLLVEVKVIEYRCILLMILEDFQHLHTLFEFYLLCVPAVGHRFIIIVFKNYMAEKIIWNILHNVPLNRELASPLILLPIVNTLLKIHWPNHLCNTTELCTSIHLYIAFKRKIGQCSSFSFASR